MKTLEAWSLVGGLAKPSKMPGFGYGLSALNCKTGSKLRKIKNSICSACYALKGRYVFPNVLNAHKRRLKALPHTLWVDAMVHLINSKKSKFFRWHDSGDLQDLEHLKKIVRVCERTPSVSHWCPTREVGILKEYKRTRALPANLVVRVSATMVNGAPHKFHEHSSTVITSKDLASCHLCPAPEQGNNCGSCRACWSPSVLDVSYIAH